MPEASKEPVLHERYGNLYWKVTSDCNANCFMCLRERSAAVIKGYEKKLFEDARKLNFMTLVFTGGEPTLRKDLSKLIYIAAGYNLKVRLDTNGLLADNEFLGEAKKDLTLLGLPLYSSTPQIHDSITGVKEHFNIVRHRSRQATELGIPLKITTAVSKRNILDIENIADYLAEKIKPRIYALNNLVKRASAPEIYEKNVVSDEEFAEMKDVLLKNKYPFKLSFCSGHKESDRAYIIVNPNFAVSMTEGDSEEILGDLKTEGLEEILSRADIDYELHMRRARDTNL